MPPGETLQLSRHCCPACPAPGCCALQKMRSCPTLKVLVPEPGTGREPWATREPLPPCQSNPPGYAALQNTCGCPTLNILCPGLGTGRGVAAVVYFVTFIMAATMIMLNLVVAVILDKFVENAALEGLFRTDVLYEVLRKKMLLERFLRLMHTKVCRGACWVQVPGEPVQGHLYAAQAPHAQEDRGLLVHRALQQHAKGCSMRASCAFCTY